MSDRVNRLRAEMQATGIHGFLVPRNDEHFGEWVPANAERLAWLTGFTGSAGLAIVLAERAAMFVDGRYTLAVRDQVDLDIFDIRHVTEEPASDWLRDVLKPGQRLGFDPWLHTAAGLAAIGKAVDAAGAELVPVARNPVDLIWQDRPAPPMAPVVPHDLERAGETAEAKRQRIAEIVKQQGADAAVLTLPESIAWLLNIRGGDVPRTPLPLGFAVLHGDARVNLFMDPQKITDAARTHMGNAVSIAPKAAFADGLTALAGKHVLVDRPSAVKAVTERLRDVGAEVVLGEDPTMLPKACKNPVEVQGSRDAHVRDGAAVVRFLAWLDAHAGDGSVDEITAAETLEGFRRRNDLIRDLSFDTISGSGPNGAIVHYRVTPETNRQLQPGELFLVDSGAQYLDGTTDITRTIAIGDPSPEMRDRFTRVLQGHVALAMARFPAGTTGSQLDPMARAPLWQAGLDFDHGTGHGVGSYLSVHEGPHRISKVHSAVALQPGMIVSNEPGYYKAGAYGIRIENLVTVVATVIEGGERPTLEFETLTLAPIDRRLIVTGMLTAAERGWIDRYHARVAETLTPLLDAETAGWLAAATQPLPG
ncbi:MULTISPECIES: aminopeptidase P family protein [unclassified Minwuia]|uniref:aminopeptidase P family protein n=1 Tax=unclassified Minwuia TaxID=2618799 RepID=UPI00247A0CCC|nr:MULTISPECIES: aminopeptidase P family protein [unclassified Minwuia]